MQGIELFKQGTSVNQIKLDEQIEKFIENCPLLYFEFLKLISNSNFDEIEFNINKVKIHDDIFLPLQGVYHGNIQGKYITICSFLNPNRLQIHLDGKESKYLVIASSEDVGNGGILVGVDNSNYDKIYKYRWEESDLHPDETELLANNIFDFIKDLKVYEMFENEYKRDTLRKFYNHQYYQNN